MVIEPSEDFDSGAVFEIPVDDVRLPCFVRLSGFEPEGSARVFSGAGPGPQSYQPAESTRRYCGRIRGKFSQNHDSDPLQHTRSTSTNAGILGNSHNSIGTKPRAIQVADV